MNYADRVLETTTSSGTGAVSMGGAVAGFQSFSSAFVTGQQVGYCLVDGNNWEVGYGTLTTGSPWTMSRDVVLGSSSAGGLITLSGGSTSVFNTNPANLSNTMTTAQGTLANENAVIQNGRQMMVIRQFSNFGTITNFGQMCIM